MPKFRGLPLFGHSPWRIAWLALTGAAVLVLLAIPLLGLLYAAGGALFGLAILACLMAAQYPVCHLLRRRLPSRKREPPR